MDNILVVKIGGGAGLDIAETCADIAEIAQSRPTIIVHGVSERMAQLSAQRQIPVEMLTSPTGHTSRYTPPAVRDLFVEAAQQVNEMIIQHLARYNRPADGLITPIVIRGTRKRAIRSVQDGRVRIIRDDYTGSIETIDTEPIIATLQRGAIAVIPPIADSPDGLLNVDGDRGAAAVAGAMDAAQLLIMTNVRGLYRDYPDETSFISHVPRQQLDIAMQWAQGRMKRKILSVHEAMDSGVSQVIISDGRIQHPIQQALAGEGTVFTA